MCQRLTSHCFTVSGDGDQPNSRGLYTHHKDFIKGGMTVPSIRSLDPGMYIYIYTLPETNIAPPNRFSQNENNVVSQPSIFRFSNC